MVTELSATSFGDFHKIVYENSAYMYRGVSNIEYPLIPKVAREWHLSANLLKMSEELMLNEFRTRAVLYLQKRPESILEWLSLAQHHGMPTRLLDWTRNPLVALHFACRANRDNDGAVYFARNIRKQDLTDNDDPFEIDDTVWVPEHITERLAAQDGLFTISKDPLEPFTKGIELRVIITKESKPIIMRTLAKYGIHSGTLFPGLDGLSEYIADYHFLLKGYKDKAEVIEFIKQERLRRKGEEWS